MNYVFKTGLFLFALAMAVFGVQHFIYARYVAMLVPGWIPLHLFWAYLVGAALIAAAISMIINKMARLACILLGIMIFLFVILIDIPSIVNHIHDSGRITDAFKEVGLGSCAFILSSTFPKKV